MDGDKHLRHRSRRRESSELKSLEITAERILKRFGYRVNLRFKFEGVGIRYMPRKELFGDTIQLEVTYFERQIDHHHTFLNEAKLSALALAIYFAALKQTPHDAQQLNLLVLDDVLIGLDMSNRLPMLTILEEEFKEYQIFFLTYDRMWYGMVKERFSQTQSNWTSIELYRGFDEALDMELPILRDSHTYLEKANRYLGDHDYKAAVMYLRNAFESCLKKFCHTQGLSVRYSSDNRHQAGELWDPARNAKNDTAPRNPDNSKPLFIDKTLATKIQVYNRFLLNPLSHDTLMTVVYNEVVEAIKLVEKLEVTLKPFSKKD